jgi:hypothetical protein
VLQGHADPALLDTYEQERVPVAQRLLQTTDRAFQLIVSDGWLAALFRTKIIAKVAAAAMRFERVRKLAFRTISQIGIRYPNSSLSQALPGLPRDAPVAGDRFPWVRLLLKAGEPAEDLFQSLDDTHFNLLVFGHASSPAEMPAQFHDVLRVHVIPQVSSNHIELTRVKVPQPSFYLLRPDGHVGLCGTHLEMAAVARYLSEQVHLGARARAGVAPIQDEPNPAAIAPAGRHGA